MENKQLLTKGVKRKLAALAAMLLYMIPAASVSAQSLFETREWTTLAKGVIYEQNRQMTSAGMLDVHILTVSLDDPYIYIEPVSSQKELGLKETVTEFLKSANAVAGVNGDFFGIAGDYSLPFGPVAEGGVLKAVSASVNENFNEFAAFFMDYGNNPFMKYMKADIRFFNGGKENIQISAYNKAGHILNYPVVVDALAMADTVALDARLPGLAKVVVENGIISQVSQKGETVKIPATGKGYVVILPSGMADTYRSRFKIGEKAELFMSNNLGLDFSFIKSAIGGGGLILQNGVVVHDKGTAIIGRQPRTAIGITKDQKQLILMTVDGRTHSIGATHDELAALLLRYGAYNAMHLDGGGSATMALRQPDSEEYAVVNTLSEGTQRRVINALGVFDRSPVGEMVRLEIKVLSDKVFVNMPFRVEVFGEDEYFHRIELPADGSVSLKAAPGSGRWKEEVYIPQETGTLYLDAKYKNFVRQKAVQVMELAELRCEQDILQVLENGVVDLSFSGISVEGEEAPIGMGVSISVHPAKLGDVVENQFVARSKGAGYLKCEMNGVVTYVPVTVGAEAVKLNGLNPAYPSFFTGYPSDVLGATSFFYESGQPIGRLDYWIKPSQETQAAYWVFETPVAMTGDPFALRLQVKGNGLGHWLRGRIMDANGQSYTIDFARNVDFTDWQECIALLPSTAQAPFKLERIYVAALSSEEPQNSVLYFKNLEALYTPIYPLALPESAVFSDPLRKDLFAKALTGGVGFDLALPVNVPYTYRAYKQDNMAVLHMAAQKGGLFNTDKSQWAKFSSDIMRLNAPDVVIALDTNPLKFTQPKEFELFHEALKKQSLHRTVFVVSCSGDETVFTIKDGVRYINIARTGRELNGAFIRFVRDANGVYYDFL